MDRKPKRRQDKIEIGTLLDKLPPHALEAEMALLGSMLHDWRVCGEVMDLLEPDDFYATKHAVIYESMVELYQARQNFDIVQLTERLKDKEMLADVGDVEYLAELAESVPSMAAAGYYARDVSDKATRRRLIRSLGESLYEAYASKLDLHELLSKVEAATLAVQREHKTGDEVYTLAEMTQRTYDELENQKVAPAMATGMADLDELHAGGIRDEEFIVVGARPSMGKTAFALQVAAHLSTKQKLPGVFYSLEMGRSQLGPRLLCSRAGVDSQKVRRNTISPDEMRRLQIAKDDLAGCPMMLDCTPGLTVERIVSRSRRLHQEQGIRWVVIDYLQLLRSAGRFDKRHEEVGHISRQLKELSRELKLPVIALAQLNRDVGNRTNFRPRMSDLRESGSIEQDADCVWLLHREAYYHKDDPNWKKDHHDQENLAEIIVEKQRSGPPGVIRMEWAAATGTFKSLLTQRQQEHADGQLSIGGY